MILELEIEQFIKEIESKLPQLSGAQLESAVSKINLLTRIKVQMLQDGLLFRQAMKDRSNSYVYGLQWKKKAKELDLDLKILKDRINE